MFKSPRHYRTFLTILLTYTLDLVGFSIAFPVLAPLLLNPNLHFFAAGAPDTLKTTILGTLFAIFGLAQLIGAPLTGALADHYGRYKTFLASIGLSIFGYLIMVLGVYTESIAWLFVGRTVTGLCSGNFALAQASTADLTSAEYRSRAFGILLGVGGLGFVAGPWFGGKLANPMWIHGSGAFLFAGIAAFINFLMVAFFFEEVSERKKDLHLRFSDTFKDIKLVFHDKTLGKILMTYLIFSTGWAFFLIFSPTFLVQKFSLNPSKIGDIFAYMALSWFFVSIFLNKELLGKFSLRAIIITGAILASLGTFLFICPNTLWPYWFIIPIALTGGALAWINLSTLLSLKASSHMQGRVLGVSGAMWSVGQIVSSLIAGPLAGWNLYSPIFVGTILLIAALVYFIYAYKN